MDQQKSERSGETRARVSKTKLDINRKKERHCERNLKVQIHSGKTKKTSPKTSKRTQVKICPLNLIFCHYVNLWSQRDIVQYSYSSLSLSLPALSSFYCAFHTNCQCAVLWKGRVVFFSFSYSRGLLEKVCYEKSWLLDGTQAVFLSPDLSVFLALLLSSCFVFGLSHIHPSSFII